MSDEAIDKLNAVFDNYDHKQDEIIKAEDDREKKRAIFLENFKQKCEEIIRPTMTKMGEAIKKRGHGYDIILQDDTTNGRDTHSINVSIKMIILPNGKNAREVPHIAFTTDGVHNKIRGHENTIMDGRGGHAGATNEYKLSGITTEAIEKEIIKLITECFNK